MRVLVTGGAGYIGSHVVRELINTGHQVTVLDNLQTGHEEAIDPRATFICANTGNPDLLIHRLHSLQIEAVMHFASDTDIDESEADPLKYYRNNFSNSLNLFHAMIKLEIKKLIFSSTAAVYGNPEKIPVEEKQHCHPLNPYGRSKFMAEMAIKDLSKAYGMSYTILRYFNVGGASPDASLGEDHKPESHLIPRILKSASNGSEVNIFGTDYETPDGTCIRDYVHVVDLARAHVLALQHMKKNEGKIYNVGNEKGFSEREVISACEEVTGKQLKVIESPRRAGDPAVLVASTRKIREELGWNPLYPGINTIIQHAWHWHSIHPQGFKGPTEISPPPGFSSGPDASPDKIVVRHG